MSKILKRAAGFLLALGLVTAVYADAIITGSKPFTFIPGTVISSSQVNADFDYIINQVNTNAAKNGANSSITSLLGLTTPIAPAFGGSSVYYATSVGGTVDAITVSATTPAISSFSAVAGNTVVFLATGANTISAPTLNVNGTGAAVLAKISSAGVLSLRPGELSTGSLVWATFSGANWIVVNGVSGFGAQVSVASSSTTDISAAGSRNALITGTTTITSLGAGANIAEPIYFVKFNGALTLTHNATSLIMPNASNYVTSGHESILAEYLGSGNWRIRAIFPGNPALSVGSVNGLTINNNAGTPTTQVDAAWTGRAILETSTGGNITVPAGSCTINAATTGVNGLDTGALANNTWYHVYIIASGFGATPSCLMSTSSTAPTLPAGIVFRYRVGAIRTLGAATFVRVRIKGDTAQYTVVAASTTPNLPSMASGTAGSVTIPTWVAVATGTFVPPTATKIRGILVNDGTTASSIAAPNNAYGVQGSTSNPPFANLSSSTGTNAPRIMPFDMVLESTDIFWASTASVNGLSAVGWTDAVNAN